MNIAQAKKSIMQTIKLYLKKDRYGMYTIPVVRQRPVFLLGAPGIGKTAIIEQIASEMGLALVSYSMTHHTRQSALGLPYIEKKNYGGSEVSVSEYTMSEIIASVYDTMEESGLKEGILFLDEINCVSETLYPSMLQFLQYKVFGRHKVPEGWVVVTAGNPPEYNRMVREFDVVTMDRLKLMEVEADKKAWMEYAVNQQVHAAILGYLELKGEHFYIMELTESGREYVTARGWEDLSRMLKACEEEDMEADEALMAQYLHHDTVVKEFAAYYELYRKYEKDYSPVEILEGRATELMTERLGNAPFDERILLAGMLCERVEADMKEVLLRAKALGIVQGWLLRCNGQDDIAEQLNRFTETRQKQQEQLEAAGAVNDDDRIIDRIVRDMVKTIISGVEGLQDEPYQNARMKYGTLLEELKDRAGKVKAELSAMFSFAEKAFGEDSQEILLLITRLTVNDHAAQFIAGFGSEDYSRLSAKVYAHETRQQLKDAISKLEL